MTDTEALVGYLFLFLARPAGTPDDPMGWAGRQLHALVVGKLGDDDPALRELADEASAGRESISPAVLRRMALAFVSAAKDDPIFVRTLAIHLKRCEAADAAMHPDQDAAVADEPDFLAGYLRYGGPTNRAISDARDSLAAHLNDPDHPSDGFGLVRSMVADCADPRNLGIEHPFTQTARNHLARFLGVTGHPNAAAAAFEALMTDCVRLLGPDDPVCRAANLAVFLGGDATLQARIEAFDAVVADAVPAFGTEHPAARSALDNQASLRNGLVNPVAVADALDEPLADFLRVLGPEHAVILNARHRVGLLLVHAASPAAAAGALRATLVDCLRALGTDHPVTTMTDHSFGQYYVMARFG